MTSTPETKAPKGFRNSSSYRTSDIGAILSFLLTARRR